MIVCLNVEANSTQSSRPCTFYGNISIHEKTTLGGETVSQTTGYYGRKKQDETSSPRDKLRRRYLCSVIQVQPLLAFL